MGKVRKASTPRRVKTFTAIWWKRLLSPLFCTRVCLTSARVTASSA
jgi:hypothetical protein